MGNSSIEIKAFELSILEAVKSKPEDDRPRPLVGVVVVKDNKILEKAHRGELDKGNHAEFTILEKKLVSSNLEGCTVFTTLEPCTSRNHPKLPCADRLIQRKVKKVWIGMVDPNKEISGKGIRKLQENGIEVQLYPPEYVQQIENINRDFTRDQKSLVFIREKEVALNKISKKVTDLTEEDLIQTTKTAIILVDISKIKDDFLYSNWSKRKEIVASLFKYQDHSNYRITLEVFSFLQEVCSNTRSGLDGDMSILVHQLILEFFPSPLDSTVEGKISELAKLSLDCAYNMVYDALIHLNNFKVAAYGLITFKFIYQYAKRNNFAQLFEEVEYKYQELEGTLNRPERSDLRKAIDLVGYFKRDLNEFGLSFPVNIPNNLYQLIRD